MFSRFNSMHTIFLETFRLIYIYIAKKNKRLMITSSVNRFHQQLGLPKHYEYRAKFSEVFRHDEPVGHRS